MGMTGVTASMIIVNLKWTLFDRTGFDVVNLAEVHR